MKRGKGLSIGLVCAIFMLSAGCIGIKQKNPGIGTFMLETVREGAVRTATVEAKLMVDVVEVLPPYDTQSLIIREDDVSFESSYYNRLILSPAENFRNNLYTWFSDSGLFKEVVLDERTGSTHRLVATVMEFYGDRKAGEAVLRMKVALVSRPEGGGRRVLFHQTYEERTPPDEFTAEGVIRAYNQSLAKILTACESDLAGALEVKQ